MVSMIIGDITPISELYQEHKKMIEKNKKQMHEL